MDKKNWIIISLSLVIIILIFIIFTGNGSTQAIIDQIREQRNELIRSTTVIESELDRSIGENTQLKADNIELRNDNTELGNIIDNLTGRSKETKEHLDEYGRINSDLADFIQQNQSDE